MLRASSESSQTKVNLRDLIVGSESATADPSANAIEGSNELLAFAEAAVTGDEDLPARRNAVIDRLGAEAMVEAAAVIGNFERMTRIADGTGIPLDDTMAAMSTDIRAELGINDFSGGSRQG
ncbi:MAG: hypothetical protein ACR2PZ_07210 [Pseudomonadales bacterium]